MDWLRRHPDDIVDFGSPGDLMPEVRGLTSLPPETARHLDYAFRHWTLVALGRTDDLDGLLEFDDLLELATAALVSSDETARFRSRWMAFRDLLESKRLAIEGRRSRRVFDLRHTETREAWQREVPATYESSGRRRAA
jgi:hypothetical protein